MKIVILNDVVIAKGNVVKPVSNGILVDNYIIGIGNFDGVNIQSHGYEIQETESADIPNDYVDNKYNLGWTLNATYLESQERVKQEAIDQYTLELIEGGIL